MKYFSFEIKTRPYTSLGSFPKEKEIETLGRKLEALCEKQTEKLSGDSKDYHLFFCEKLNLQQVDFRFMKTARILGRTENLISV